jgi:hypothetical protein
MTLMNRSASHFVGFPVELDLDDSLEPLREVLRGFVGRHLAAVLGRRAWQVTGAHADILRVGGVAVTCHLHVVLEHGPPLTATTTATDLQTAIEVTIERIGHSLAVRRDGTRSRSRL